MQRTAAGKMKWQRFCSRTDNRNTSTKFIAPRRRERKEKIFCYLSELSVLCVFARVIFPIPYSEIQAKISIICPTETRKNPL